MSYKEAEVALLLMFVLQKPYFIYLGGGDNIYIYIKKIIKKLSGFGFVCMQMNIYAIFHKIHGYIFHIANYAIKIDGINLSFPKQN